MNSTMTTVNKKTIARRPVKYAALSSGTVSAVWYDEDHAAKDAQKRRNAIRLHREKANKGDRYDA